uniref:DUF1263 domain-containing protein n=2 Tax=Oryza sativa subsp. japonica TaxID=39947 RepID=Q10BN9_ORYSJ|nr:hypothetical protein [Oryza sativa Japonica Group]ABF99478.1 retrotransposon protein, putative, Ty3-gypsy subclass [Oryza sativa Japonica Group]
MASGGGMRSPAMAIGGAGGGGSRRRRRTAEAAARLGSALGGRGRGKEGRSASPRVGRCGGRRRRATGERRRWADELRDLLGNKMGGIRGRGVVHGGRKPWPKAAVVVVLTGVRGDAGSGDGFGRADSGRGGSPDGERGGVDGVSTPAPARDECLEALIIPTGRGEACERPPVAT